jgi:hypothetical protein
MTSRPDFGPAATLFVLDAQAAGRCRGPVKCRTHEKTTPAGHYDGHGVEPQNDTDGHRNGPQRSQGAPRRGDA